MTQSTEQPELLPCPFCGAVPTLEGSGNIRWIKCPPGSACGSSGMAMGISSDDIERGITAWNRRAPASQAQRLPLSDAQIEDAFIEAGGRKSSQQFWLIKDVDLHKFVCSITQEKQ